MADPTDPAAPASGVLVGDAVRVLRAWVAPDAAQETLRGDYLQHLAMHPDGVWRTGPPAHLTASCLVLDASRTRALLTLHARANRWFQLGGHLEADDRTLADAALREALEESGLRADDLVLHPEPVHLDRHELLGSFGRCREHLDVRYVAVAGEGAVPVVSSESLDLAWWPLDRLPLESADELAPLVSAALSSLGASSSSTSPSSRSEPSRRDQPSR